MSDIEVNFRRLPDGRVHLNSSSPDTPFNFTLDPDAWARIVAGVSAQGSAPERVGLIRNFHMYVPAGVDANGSQVADEGGKPAP